jgi:hypothetical protein
MNETNTIQRGAELELPTTKHGERKRDTNFFQLGVCVLDALLQSVIYPIKENKRK